MPAFILAFALVFVFLPLPACIAAQENPAVVVPLEVVANQAVESASVIEQQTLQDPPIKETPLKVEVMPVVANQQEVLDDRVSPEPLMHQSNSPAVSGEQKFFNRMKQLAGRWEGAGENMPAEGQNKIVVIYEVTAGGNAVLERIFPGTSQEMVTMYYEEKGQLTLTHYCLIGTRSVMKLQVPQGNLSEEQKKVFEFQLAESPALDPTIDTHMHSLKITFVDDNHMNQSWEMYEAGKLSGSYSFVLVRALDNS